MRIRICALVAGVCGLACSISANFDGAIAGDQPGVLGLRTGAVRLAELPNRLADADAFAPGKYFVIQLDGPLTPERDAALGAIGVRRYEYLPTNCFIAELSGTTPRALAALGFVASAVEYRSEWRIDPTIGNRAYQTEARRQLAAAGRHQVGVFFFEGVGQDAAIASIAGIPGLAVAASDFDGSCWFVDAEVDGAALARLAQLDQVQFVEDYPEILPRNGTNRWIVQSNVNGSFPLYDQGIHGEGQVLGHMDGRVGESQCAFDDSVPIGENHRKIVAYLQSQGYDSHGAHTAGTAVGDPGSDTNNRGIAYLAKMVHNAWPSFTDGAMYSRLSLHYGTYGATMHTNSWGDDGTTAYTSLCRGIDRFTYDFEDNLVCFAVTNQSTLKTPENAKNCLAVGASQDTPSQGNHCSGGRGPTNDGRRKPEIYAPGCNTNSATGSSGCNTTTMTGTSMACPAVTGTALLVRQYFMDGFYPSGTERVGDGFTPSGALVKGVLINGSVDMTGVTGYPSDTEGWGRVLAGNSLFFDGDQRTLQCYDVRNRTPEGLTTGEVVEYQFEVTGSTEQLRVTLCWVDPPAAINANPAFINNLDLEVIKPDGVTLYKGNVFSGGVSITGGSADLKNNLEQVHLNGPSVGTWTARIRGTAVQDSNSQGYAIAITGQIATAAPCEFDCDGDGQCDDDEIAGGEPDCNNNGIPDNCDVDPDFGGLSADCQQDGVPDECQLEQNDCDNDGVPEECEEDCNQNGVSDPCDLLLGFADDCNSDGVLDECDPNHCAADLAAPFGTLNIFDFLAFQTLFSDGDSCADMAAPFGQLNVFDFLAFQNSYSEGC